MTFSLTREPDFNTVNYEGALMTPELTEREGAINAKYLAKAYHILYPYRPGMADFVAALKRKSEKRP